MNIIMAILLFCIGIFHFIFGITFGFYWKNRQLVEGRIELINAAYIIALILGSLGLLGII